MTIQKRILDYLQKCRSGEAPVLHCGSDRLRGIDQVVVIPALAEKRYLFSTLASLARNAPEELERTLVICVINNRPLPYVLSEVLKDNRETLEILQSLCAGKIPAPHKGDFSLNELFREILQSRLRLAYLDASSPGNEMPMKKGGVGLARKWGLDAGLAVMDHGNDGGGRMLCLDADSPVSENYLSAVRSFYEIHDSTAAVVAYAHSFPEDPSLLAAICSYETFLRCYVLGLKYAESPYAFHTIGSTMSCTVRGYVAVRGMSRREAGEDFYFLNKLAKLSPMGKITAARVYPSSRPSGRVPFGTGQRMKDFLEGSNRGDFFYDPKVFLVLKQWLKGMTMCIAEGGTSVRQLAGDISPRLYSFLEVNDFPAVWERICRTHKSADKRAWHFQEWFDAFRTMKLIHFLTETDCPAVGLWQAVPKLMEWMEQPFSESPGMSAAGRVPEVHEQIEILSKLRELDFWEQK